MAQKMLDDLFHDTLKDIYYAERQILKALPKDAARRESEAQGGLRKAQGTDRDPRRAPAAGVRDFGKRAQGKTCEAIRASSPRARRS